MSPPDDAEVEQTVGFAPAREWLGLGQVIAVSEEPAAVPSPTVVLVREGEPEGPVVFAQLVADPPPTLDSIDGEPGAVPLTAGALSGLGGFDEATGHLWVSVGRGSRRVDLWAGVEVAAEALLELAGAVDLGRPVEEQGPLAGWVPRTTSTTALGRATIRRVEAVLPAGAGAIEVAAWRDTGTGAVEVLGGATVAERRPVRGTIGLVSAGPSGREVTVTWEESPGLVGQLRLQVDEAGGRDGLVDRALAEVEHLTRLDEDGWTRVAASARARQVVTPEDLDPLEGRTVVFRGVLQDGRRYSITEERGLLLCTTVEGHLGVTRCDTHPQFWRGGTNEAVPRLLDPGHPDDVVSPVVLYGYLPSRHLSGPEGAVQEAVGQWIDHGRAVAVEVRDIRDTHLGWATLLGPVWVHHVPHDELPLVVTYHFRDGSSLEVAPSAGHHDGEGEADEDLPRPSLR